jgi:hypothetical protein
VELTVVPGETRAQDLEEVVALEEEILEESLAEKL